MAVKQYSLREDGQTKLTEHFRVREFACKDGSDLVLIEEALVSLLQQLRDYFGAPVTITSGYRTQAHNQAVGGASQSLHLQGRAADIVVQGVEALEVARQAERVQVGGIGLYHGYVHLDVRSGKYYWDQRGGSAVSVESFGAASYDSTPATMPTAAVEQKAFTVDGREVRLRAILEQGENYVHLRDLMTALQGQVEYRAAERQVLIYSAQP